MGAPKRVMSLPPQFYLPDTNKQTLFFPSLLSLLYPNTRCEIFPRQGGLHGSMCGRYNAERMNTFGGCSAGRQLNKAGSEWGTCCIGGVFSSLRRQAGPRHRNRPQADNMHTASGNPVDVENTSSQAAAGAVNVPILHPHRFRTCVKGWKRSVYNFQESN